VIQALCGLAEIQAEFDEAKIAMGEVRSLQALSETKWAWYWGAIQEVSDRHGGTYRLPGRPWHFSTDQLETIGDPPFQGEHNRTVFSEFGQSNHEIERYIGTGALVSAVPPSTAPSNEPATA
jgi:crotonobetainyl-CoA:carnitine CoA-transferase CaiB-like acyl-CoA transferase